MKSCFSILTLILLTFTHLQSQEAAWQRTFGGPGDQSACGIHEMDNGDILVLVNERPDPTRIDFSARLYSLDASGNLLQDIWIPSFRSNRPRKMIAHNDSTFLIGGAGMGMTDFEYPYLMEIDARANVSWQVLYDSLYQDMGFREGVLQDIDPLPGGGYLLTTMGLEWEMGQLPVWHDCLIRVDERGKPVSAWSAPLGPGGFPETGAVVSDSIAYLVGNSGDMAGEARHGYVARINFLNGNRTQRSFASEGKTWEFRDVEVVGEGRALITGARLENGQTAGILLLEIDDQLNPIRELSNPTSEWYPAVGADLLPLPYGEWALVGTATNQQGSGEESSEAFLATVRNSGDLVFAGTFAEAGTWGSSFSAVEASSNGYFLACGTSLNWNDPQKSNEAWVVKVECRSDGSQLMPASQGVVAYPNPTSGNLNLDWLELESCISPNARPEVEIFDATGRRISLPTTSTLHGMQLRTHNLASGTYWIRLSGENGLQRTVKFIKAKNLK
jgi:hypothetical protein